LNLKEVLVNEGAAPSTGRLILVPALITLAVTLLRLTGELLNWSPALFNRQPGGPGAIVGIVWLVFVFGIYFAVRLVRAGLGPSGLGRVFGFAFLALLIPVVVGVGGARLKAGPLAQLGLLAVASIPAIVVAMRGWPALGRVLLAYGLAARIPVALVMLAAILGNWGTHYDVLPPAFPEMSAIPKWFLIGLVPQLTGWLAFTVVVGMLMGGLTAAVMGRRAAPRQAVPATS
jgi:hypothetical protein